MLDPFLKIGLPKNRYPNAWPTTAAMKIPPLKDMTDNITKYANPALIEWIPIWKKTAAARLDSGFRFTMLILERNSTIIAKKKTKIIANAYIPEL